MFKEQIHVLKAFERASQGHKFAHSHDPENEPAAPDKFREGKMGGGLMSLVIARKTFASGDKSQTEKKFKRPKYIILSSPFVHSVILFLICVITPITVGQ